MRKYFSRKYLFPILAFCIIDLIAIGTGMGVPIFAILFGFIVGWIAPSIIIPSATNLRQLLKECIFVSLLTSCYTFLVMIILWGPVTRMLLERSADYANFGIPMILYDPKVSFIGWIILMIFISPILQLLATVFSSAVHIVWRIPNYLQEESKPM